MEAQTRPQTPSKAPPLTVDRAFFGQDNCLTVQLRGDTCYFKWGEKKDGGWEWKNVKFSDAELGEIVRVLEGVQDEASFYHSFNDAKTRLWFSRLDNGNVVCKADERTKGLNPGEQKVLETLLSHMIWMMNLA